MNETDSSTTRSKSAQQTRASERVSAQRKSTPRMLRTILLGTVAMVAGIIWLGDQYGVERQETIELMLASAGFVLGLTAAGVLGAVFIRLLRHVFNLRGSACSAIDCGAEGLLFCLYLSAIKTQTRSAAIAVRRRLQGPTKIEPPLPDRPGDRREQNQMLGSRHCCRDCRQARDSIR